VSDWTAVSTLVMSAGPARSKGAGVDAGLAALLGAVIGLLGGLGATLISLRGERTRTRDDRLWRERAPLYTQLIAWQEDVNTWALGRAGPTAPRPDLVGPELHAQLLIFAGDAALRWLEPVETQLERAAPPGLPRSSDNAESQLHVYAEALLDAIQEEFVKGRARSWKEERRLGIGSRSLRSLFLGGGPRHRPP